MLKNYLNWFDYCILAGTLLFSLGIGVFYSLRGNKSNNKELLAGGRNMGAIPVAASILVSYLSAISILGSPAEVYTYGIQVVFQVVILDIAAMPISIHMFAKPLYDLELTSAFKYLELRYNSVAVRWGMSLIFILQMLLLTGIALYAPAIAMETMMGIPKLYSVIAIGVCGTAYTSVGGIKAVVWTDAFQLLMIFIGMSAIVVRGIVNAGGISEMFRISNEGGRLQVFDWTVNPFMRQNTLNLTLGCLFTTSWVCEQMVVQRFCGLKSYKEAVKSLWWNQIFGSMVAMLVILTGMAIYAHYANCDPLTLNLIEEIDQIVPYFVVEELAFIPGMMGLFVVVIFCAVLSTISSSLNSLAAVTWEDFLSKLSFFEQMEDNAQATTYKILTITYGIIGLGLSFIADSFGGLYQSVWTITGTAAGASGALFTMGLFFPFVNKHGALWGMLIGMLSMIYVTLNAINVGQQYDINPRLPMSTSNCSSFQIGIHSASTNHSSQLLSIDELDFPNKLFSVSYQLYPFIGTCITMIAAFVVSLLTGGCTDAKYVRPEYIHPIVRPKTYKFTANPTTNVEVITEAHELQELNDDTTVNCKSTQR